MMNQENQKTSSAEAVFGVTLSMIGALRSGILFLLSMFAEFIFWETVIKLFIWGKGMFAHERWAEQYFSNPLSLRDAISAMVMVILVLIPFRTTKEKSINHESKNNPQ